MKSLENWAPECLKELYEAEVGKLKIFKLSQKQKEVCSWKAEALYRLGTYDDMKITWDKLLSKKTLLKQPFNLERELVGGIHKLVWLNSYGIKQATPADRRGQFEEIAKKIRELQKLIKKVGEADFEEKVIIETILHKRNMEYRVQKGEKLPPEPSSFLKFIQGNASSELRDLSLGDHIPWKKRSQVQRLGWWAEEALKLNLNDILCLYSERMGDYSKSYKDNYALFQPKLIKGLKSLMKNLYGSPLEDYVSRFAAVILEKNITKEYLRGYKD